MCQVRVDRMCDSGAVFSGWGVPEGGSPGKGPFTIRMIPGGVTGLLSGALPLRRATVRKQCSALLLLLTLSLYDVSCGRYCSNSSIPVSFIYPSTAVTT